MEFIADIASNHNSNLDTLLELIEACSNSGVTCIKLQSFKADKLVSNNAFNSLGKSGTHQDSWKESVFESYKRAETPIDWLRISHQECRKRGLKLMTSPYDEISLMNSLKYLNGIKIGSGDIDNDPILEIAFNTELPIYIATGACDLNDIQITMDLYKRVRKNFSKISIMQCNTNYTANREMSFDELCYQYKNINLLVLDKYKTLFKNANLGLSDHTITYDSALIATICFDVKCIEKHFTLDHSQTGQDHSFSLNPDDWLEMCSVIKKCKNLSRNLNSFDEKLKLCLDYCKYPDAAKLLIGDGVKKIEENEYHSSIVQRRGIVSNKNLKKNHIIEIDDISFLRPRPKNGFSPREINFLLGKKLNTSVNNGQNILFSHVDK